eukprot:TRINITY_DN17840_c0_g1_i1.p1 TRINITY_DN17840_c0_g1~~TRINITY_DN17840_c0_g1_i1.p1  ORF type:complete len:400 (+),score=59.51 TRINITY_DN17840_c0_g1_i1:29-1201(+)
MSTFQKEQVQPEQVPNINNTKLTSFDNESLDEKTEILTNQPKQVTLLAKIIAYICLGIAVCAAGCAAIGLRALENVPPLLRSGWRQALVLVPLFPLFMYTYAKSTPEVKAHFKEQRILLGFLSSGIALWVHFGFWTWSIDLTSITHALLFVCSTPVVLVIGIWLVYAIKEVFLLLYFRTYQIGYYEAYPNSIWLKLNHPSVWETLGMIVAFVGFGLTTLDTEEGGEASIFGDFIAFLGAVSFVPYLLLGMVVRRGIPTFLYVFPVYAVSAFFLIGSSLILEDTTFVGLTERSVFGWMSSWYLFGWTLGLALVPSLLGHTLINFCLEYIDPVIISISLLLEPIIASFIAWMIGFTEAPDVWTYVGGFILTVALIFVTLATKKREKETGTLF